MEHSNPVFLPLEEGEPQGDLMEMQERDRGESEGPFVMKGIEVETSPHVKASRLPRGLL